MSRPIILVSVVAALLVGSIAMSPAHARKSQPAPVKSPEESAAWRATQADELYYTSLKFLFGHNESSMGDMASAYYIVMPNGDGIGDPSDAFLARFEKIVPVVKKGSDCKTAGAITDRKLNSAGLLFFVESIEWITDEEAIVEGGYEEDAATAARVTCRLKYDRKRWKVAKSVERAPRAPAPPK